MSGCKQRDDFIAKLLVRHSSAALIAGFHQHGKQIRDPLGLAATLGNNAVNDRVNVGQRSAVFTVAPCRNAERRRKDRPGTVHGIVAANIERPADRFGVGFKIGGEKHLRRDVEREAHEVRHHIENLILCGAALPSPQHCQSIFRHCANERGHLLALK